MLLMVKYCFGNLINNPLLVNIPCANGKGELMACESEFSIELSNGHCSDSKLVVILFMLHLLISSNVLVGEADYCHWTAFARFLQA